MHKLLPIAALFATVQIALAVPDARAWSFCPSSNTSAAGAHGPDGAILLAGGMGGGGTGAGGMGGGGMGGGGMGAGGMGGGGMGGGGMGGGFMGGGMGNGPATGDPMRSLGPSGDDPSVNSAEPTYYTYQCITPAGRCAFAAPSSLRSGSLRSGERCVCSSGQTQGRIE